MMCSTQDWWFSFAFSGRREEEIHKCRGNVVILQCNLQSSLERITAGLQLTNVHSVLFESSPCCGMQSLKI